LLRARLRGRIPVGNWRIAAGIGSPGRQSAPGCRCGAFAQQSDRRLWEDLAARAIGVPVSYRPAPGIAVYHLSVDDYVVMAAEHDLAGPLLDLVTAVMALGGEC
jgi:hypothetical protein